MLEDRLLSIVNDTDVLRLTMRGHQYIDKLLGQALSRSLAHPHAVEIGRLTFPLKVDLGVATGVLNEDSRALFMTLNRVRNRFAHDEAAELTDQDSRALLRALSPFHRDLLDQTPLKEPGTPFAALRAAIAVAGIEMRAVLSHQQQNEAEKVALMEMVAEAIGPLESYHIPADLEAEIQQRITAKLTKE